MCITTEESNPKQKQCIYFSRGSCNKGENCPFLHSTTESTSSLQQKLESLDLHGDSSKSKKTLCAAWAYGTCQFGARCRHIHPIRKPLFKEVLEHKMSTSEIPDMNDGIMHTKPDLPGLPDLPTNGKCRIMGDYVIYFLPFWKDFEGKYFFKKIQLFRLNKQKGMYKLVFSYRKENFHITTAAASNGYLVCSRIPYDASVLQIMREAKALAKRNEILQKKESHLQSKVVQQIEKNKSLYNANKNLSSSMKKQKKRIDNLESTQVNLQEKLSRRSSHNKPTTGPSVNKRSKSSFKQEGERKTKYKSTTINLNVTVNITQKTRLTNLQKNVFANFRDLDPIDIFVYHPIEKTMVHVLEYHKPADHVHLEKNMVTLYDMPSQQSHVFCIEMSSSNISAYDFVEPLRPSTLCDYF